MASALYLPVCDQEMGTLFLFLFLSSCVIDVVFLGNGVNTLKILPEPMFKASLVNRWAVLQLTYLVWHV